MWLDRILKIHSEYESPEQFWFWASLTSISAVVKDNVYINKFLYNLYPNIYVLLHADSGLKKGAPIAMARKLVGHVNNTKVFSGRFSIQGLLKELGRNETEPGGLINGGAAGFICLSEMTGSIVNDPAAFDILTDLFDRIYRFDKYSSVLKGERFELVDPILTAIMGTNEAHSDSFFDKKDVSGGFLARTFVVTAKAPKNFNSLMFQPEIELNYKAEAEYLKEIAKLKGPFKLEDDVRSYFDTWYKSFRSTTLKSETIDKTGALNRFDDSVLKTAMLISLADKPDLVITKDHLDRAIAECQKLVGNIRRATLGKGKNVYAQEKALIINELLTRETNSISRKTLNERFWAYASHEDWDKIMAGLEVAGIIRIESIGNQVVYRMEEGVVTKLRQELNI